MNLITTSPHPLTGMIPHFGDSMQPVFNAGDRLAVKKLKNLDTILWGEAYLIVTGLEYNEIIIVRFVFPGDDNEHFTLRSTAPENYGDIKIKKIHIQDLYIITESISITHY